MTTNTTKVTQRPQKANFNNNEAQDLYDILCFILLANCARRRNLEQPFETRDIKQYSHTEDI